MKAEEFINIINNDLSLDHEDRNVSGNLYLNKIEKNNLPQLHGYKFDDVKAYNFNNHNDIRFIFNTCSFNSISISEKKVKTEIIIKNSTINSLTISGNTESFP